MLAARVRPPADADPLEGMVLGARGDWRGAARLLNWRYYGGCYDAGMSVRALLELGDLDRGLEWLGRAFEERTAMAI